MQIGNLALDLPHFLRCLGLVSGDYGGLKFGPWLPIERARPECDVVEVRCRYGELGKRTSPDDKWNYQYLHAQIYEKDDNSPKRFFFVIFLKINMGYADSGAPEIFQGAGGHFQNSS